MERRRSDAGAIAGLLLILLGVLILLAQRAPRGFLDLDAGHYGWPLFLLVPGAVILAFGLVSRDAAGLCVPGAILTALGLLVAVQNALDAWATAAYAWTLVAPFGVGLGMWLAGLRGRRPSQRSAGARLMIIGIVLFGILAAFFEGLLHLSGGLFGDAGKVLFPALLVALGVAVLARARIIRRPGRLWLAGQGREE